jgi:hypothetical protein
METIDLDCPPGAPRPCQLIAGVIEGTGLELPAEHPTPFFGAAEYSFDVPREKWEAEIQPIIKPRIEALYHSGQIRYGSW